MSALTEALFSHGSRIFRLSLVSSLGILSLLHMCASTGASRTTTSIETPYPIKHPSNLTPATSVSFSSASSFCSTDSKCSCLADGSSILSSPLIFACLSLWSSIYSGKSSSAPSLYVSKIWISQRVAENWMKVSHLVNMYMMEFLTTFKQWTRRRQPNTLNLKAFLPRHWIGSVSTIVVHLLRHMLIMSF